MLNSLEMKRWWKPRELSMKVDTGHQDAATSCALTGSIGTAWSQSLASFMIRLFLFLFQSLPYRPGWPIEAEVWCKFYPGYEEGKSWTAINIPKWLKHQELGKGWVCLGRIHATCWEGLWYSGWFQKAGSTTLSQDTQGALDREYFSNGVLREEHPSVLCFTVMPQCNGSAILKHGFQPWSTPD